MSRRAPGALLLLLLAGVQPATASAVDGDGEITFEVPLHVGHGLTAKLGADDDELDLTVTKGIGQQAVYFARKEEEVSADGISADFGRFGEFVVDYRPFRTLQTREPGPRCEGEPYTWTKGVFRGTLRFRGERGYFRVETSRAKGTRALRPAWKCRYPGGGDRHPREQEGGRDEATLAVSSRRGPIRFAALGWREAGERAHSDFLAFSREIRDGVGIVRYTSAGTRSDAFRYDNRRGTALVDPPAPFAGSARFLRRRGAPDRWTGDLTAPLLGAGRVRLTGPGFDARMVPRYPQFE